MVEIIDRIVDAFQVLTSDWGRFAGIFLITGMIYLCIIAADGVIPGLSLQATHGITISCVGVKVPLVFPLFTHITSMSTTGAQLMTCAVNQIKAVALVAYYLQIQALVFIGVIAGIIILNLGG